MEIIQIHVSTVLIQPGPLSPYPNTARVKKYQIFVRKKPNIQPANNPISRNKNLIANYQDPSGLNLSLKDFRYSKDVFPVVIAAS